MTILSGLFSSVWGTIISIIALICVIWVIYDVLVKNKGLSTEMKFLWIILAIILGGIIPAVIYYLVYKK